MQAPSRTRRDRGCVEDKDYYSEAKVSNTDSNQFSQESTKADSRLVQPQSPTPSPDPDLPHLSSASAELFRKMTSTSAKRPLSSIKPAYPGDEEPESQPASIPAKGVGGEDTPNAGRQEPKAPAPGTEADSASTSSSTEPKAPAELPRDVLNSSTIQDTRPNAGHPPKSIPFPDLSGKIAEGTDSERENKRPDWGAQKIRQAKLEQFDRLGMDRPIDGTTNPDEEPTERKEGKDSANREGFGHPTIQEEQPERMACEHLAQHEKDEGPMEDDERSNQSGRGGSEHMNQTERGEQGGHWRHTDRGESNVSAEHGGTAVGGDDADYAHGGDGDPRATRRSRGGAGHKDEGERGGSGLHAEHGGAAVGGDGDPRATRRSRGGAGHKDEGERGGSGLHAEHGGTAVGGDGDARATRRSRGGSGHKDGRERGGDGDARATRRSRWGSGLKDGKEPGERGEERRLSNRGKRNRTREYTPGEDRMEAEKHLNGINRNDYTDGIDIPDRTEYREHLVYNNRQDFSEPAKHRNPTKPWDRISELDAAEPRSRGFSPDPRLESRMKPQKENKDMREKPKATEQQEEQPDIRIDSSRSQRMEGSGEGKNSHNEEEAHGWQAGKAGGHHEVDYGEPNGGYHAENRNGGSVATLLDANGEPAKYGADRYRSIVGNWGMGSIGDGQQDGSREQGSGDLQDSRNTKNPEEPDGCERIIEVNKLRKGYVKGKNMIPVLNGVDISVRDGEFLSIVGQSGSGKSTLLHLMGTLDIPDSGTVHFDGQRIDNLPGRQRDYIRNRYIGMIFQFYHLIPEMTMIENVLAPLMIRESLFGYFKHRRKYIEQAKELLDLVGLSHRIKHRPNELSGGEMQRTSIARALITNPHVLLADEPTGNLDSKTTIEIIKLLRSLNAEKKLTIIMVTHDMEQAWDADRVVRLVDGRVTETFRTSR